MSELDRHIAGPLRTLQLLPAGVGAAVFIRHAERPEIPKGVLAAEVLLTDAGTASARRLGQTLGRRLRRMHTSPVPRCQMTAAALISGAGQPLSPIVVPHLGEPGLFVQDIAAAGPQFLEHGVQIMAYRLGRGEPLCGFSTAADGASLLLHGPLSDLPPAGGLDLYVTHDYILSIVATLVLGRDAAWPDFLDCFCVWREGGAVAFCFGEELGVIPQHLIT